MHIPSNEDERIQMGMYISPNGRVHTSKRGCTYLYMGMYTPPNEDVHSPHGDVQNPNEDVQSRKHDVFRFGTQNGRFWCHEIVI